MEIWTFFVNQLQKYYSFWESARGKEKNYYDEKMLYGKHSSKLCNRNIADGDFAIDKDDDDAFKMRTRVFKEATKTRKSLMFTLMTTNGLKKNKYSGRVQKLITFDDLFRF